MPDISISITIGSDIKVSSETELENTLTDSNGIILTDSNGMKLLDSKPI